MDSFGTKNKDPGMGPGQCYILALESTCSRDQADSVRGDGLLHDYILIDQNQTSLFPGVGNNRPSATTASGGGSPTGSAAGSATSSGMARPVGLDRLVLGSVFGIGVWWVVGGGFW